MGPGNLYPTVTQRWWLHWEEHQPGVGSLWVVCLPFPGQWGEPGAGLWPAGVYWEPRDTEVTASITSLCKILEKHQTIGMQERISGCQGLTGREGEVTTEGQQRGFPRAGTVPDGSVLVGTGLCMCQNPQSLQD